ncbi:hypothetical protein QNI16_01160 [Cytophagaceae bacterium YF14B1]|uniref:Uncharacterized protein n=1 Tax=Xanthocytophaga flava TaxID=3048013 RepID=A0AAE3U3T7_9BACT|nr:hypothetical protein [Xanthocytophaga flavus]MDJ1479069.1 hypothetical protein [Xanthocytophaga flavus]
MNSDDFFVNNTNPRFTQSTFGCLDVMGGTAEYAGSLVLFTPEQTCISIILALRNDTTIRLYKQSTTAFPDFQIDISALLQQDRTVNQSILRDITASQYTTGIVAACIVLFSIQQNIALTGLDVYIQSPSDQPETEPKEALAISILKALAEANQVVFIENELPILAHNALQLLSLHHLPLANTLASYYVKPGYMLPILCQPDHVSSTFIIPEGLGFASINMGPKSNKQLTLQEQVYTAASIGYTMISLYDGTYPHELDTARKTGNRENLLYNGYLANITPNEFDNRYKWLPKHVYGSTFLEKSGILVDSALSVFPDISYPVFQATVHPIYENIRAQYFSLLLQHMPETDDVERRQKSLQQLGNWMFQSHTSYAALGLSNPTADRLIQWVQQHLGKGVFGARLTHSNTENSVCILWEGQQGYDTIQAIYQVISQEAQSPISLRFNR